MPEGPHINGSSLQFLYGAKSRLVDLADATYYSCLTDPALSSEARPELGELGPNVGICIETTAGRVAVATVVGEATPREVDLNVTVWEKE
jgi:hypothetical protein